MDAETISRPSARVILIAPGPRVRMFRGGDPTRPGEGTWWATPGGGIDPGETPEAAARRELFEETGQIEVEWGGLVATRSVQFSFMGHVYQSDQWVFVAYTESLQVKPSTTDRELETIEEQALARRFRARGIGGAGPSPRAGLGSAAARERALARETLEMGVVIPVEKLYSATGPSLGSSTRRR